jgi:hypothetical protein
VNLRESSGVNRTFSEVEDDMALSSTFKEVVALDLSLNVRFDDMLFSSVGRAYSPGMAEKATEWLWLCRILVHLNAGGEGRRGSKI